MTNNESSNVGAGGPDDGVGIDNRPPWWRSRTFLLILLLVIVLVVLIVTQL